MRIVILGGTGLVGAKLVRLLSDAGHETIVAARSTGVDTVTGEGLIAALDGADAVVDASNPGYAESEAMLRFFQASGANLFAAEHTTRIAHHVVFSAIGAGHIDDGFYRAKEAQERLVALSGIPFTIVRATPLFEYLYAIVSDEREPERVRVPPVRMRPIAAEDVARVLARVAIAGPAGGVVEVAGPETFALSVLAEEVLAANEDPRRVVVDSAATFFGAHVDDRPLTGGEVPADGAIGFEDWLRQSLVPA
jgi:uncharacterized protein YbjT (DUF2867 family)